MENRRKGNQRKNRIFWKVFIVNIIMLLLIVIIAYLLLYFLLPTFYRNYKLREFEELTLNVIERIEREQNEAEELLKFSNEYNVDVLLKDKYDNIIFDYYKSDTIVTNVEQEQDMPEIFVQMDEEMSKMAELCMSYKLHNEYRELYIMIPLEPIDEAKAVVIEIYPYACMVCFIFVFLLSIGFTNMFVKPIKIISRVTKNMSNLEPDAHIEIYSNDEIGELSEDINQLYSELKSTIDCLNLGNYSEPPLAQYDFGITV